MRRVKAWKTVDQNFSLLYFLLTVKRSKVGFLSSLTILKITNKTFKLKKQKLSEYEFRGVLHLLKIKISNK